MFGPEFARAIRGALILMLAAAVGAGALIGAGAVWLIGVLT